MEGSGRKMYSVFQLNTVAITYSSYNVIVVQPDGTNSFEKRINATYSVFRADRLMGTDKSLTDLSEKEFFSKSKSQLFSNEIIDAPSPGGGAKAIGNIYRAGVSLGKLGAFKYAAKYGMKTYDELKGIVKEAGNRI